MVYSVVNRYTHMGIQRDKKQRIKQDQIQDLTQIEHE